MPFERELRVARDLAWRAGEVALRFQREGFEAEDKPDASPVTEADRACERVFVEGLTAAFPDDGLLGEEGASKEECSLIEQVQHIRVALGGLAVELDTSQLPSHLRPGEDLPDRPAFMRSLPGLIPALSETIIADREDRI